MKKPCFPLQITSFVSATRPVRFIRERGDVVYVQDVADALGVNKAFTSRLLAQAVLSGKIRNLGHQKGWIATE